MHRWRSAALLGAWAAGACSGEKSTAPRPYTPGAATVVATRARSSRGRRTAPSPRSRSTAPRLCRASPTFGGRFGGGTAGIASGVRLGVVPSGAAQETAPRDLSGSGLIVRVFGADGSFLGSVQTDVP